MIVFCEECGGKNCLQADSKGNSGSSRYCRICREPLKNTVGDDIGTAASLPTVDHQIRVMIVDDSTLIRQAVRRIIETSDHLCVAGEAKNGAEALDLLPRLDPDVITLDINMPVMDGLTALKHIMIQKPKPTVVFSTLTREGSREAFRALEYGAVDVLHKPSRLADMDLRQQHRLIIQKIGLAADVKTEAIQYIRNTDRLSGEKVAETDTSDYAVTMGAAEGGYSGLLRIIPRLRPDTRAAFLVLLYAPASHVGDFTRYLDQLSAIRVCRATDSSPLYGGVCHIASEDEYMTIERNGGAPMLRVQPAPFSQRRGAVNMLMFSVAETFGDQSTGVVLSGKGRDGQEGLQEIIRVGGSGIVQDPNSCLYKEMAQSIIENCDGQEIVMGGGISHQINRVLDDPPVAVNQ